VPPAPELAFTTAGAPRPGAPLIIASGAAGAAWARGAQLGEQAAGLYADGVQVPPLPSRPSAPSSLPRQVGALFAPAWAESNVLVSEATARLPAAAMHAYAAHVLRALAPPRCALTSSAHSS
jgi:hypothetical protein